MPVTMWGQVVDGLLAVMRARSGYRAPSTASDDIPVFDGPQVAALEENTTRFLVIGWAGDVPGDRDSGTAGQQLIALASSNRPTEENGTVSCLAVAQIGDQDPATVRAQALAIIGDVDTALRGQPAGPTLGIDPGTGNGQLLWALVGDQARVTQYSAGGSVCEIEFSVVYKARI
jgi:hypothetical protein